MSFSAVWTSLGIMRPSPRHMTGSSLFAAKRLFGATDRCYEDAIVLDKRNLFGSRDL